MNRSGNHLPFEDFVHGDLKQMYYHLALDDNKAIADSVDVSLPDDVFHDSNAHWQWQ